MKMNCDARGRRRLKFTCGILGVALVLIGPVLIGPGAWGQTGESATTEKGSTASRQDVAANARVDSRPFQTFYLANVSAQNDASEITVAVRNLLPPDVKIYIVPSQNALTMRGTADELALAQKIISDLDRPKKTYRLTFTTTETDGGKRVGVQHFAMLVAAGQRTVMKQGSKVPIATGSYNASGNTGAQTQFTYIDVGMNFDAMLDELANGARLRSKVEQLSIAEQTSGVGVADPIIRQSSLEGTSFLTLGKPLVLGSIDIPGSTRHMDIEVVMEQVAK
jgi:type II secretory pathway component GspD/PulD (secretin)